MIKILFQDLRGVGNRIYESYFRSMFNNGSYALQH